MGVLLRCSCWAECSPALSKLAACWEAQLCGQVCCLQPLGRVSKELTLFVASKMNAASVRPGPHADRMQLLPAAHGNP